ncbi:unnamed protein product [Diplocarpon coronariae]
MARFSVSERVDDFKTMVETDTTTQRVGGFIVAGAPQLPLATTPYLLDKVPILSWLITDSIAGLTLGVMLIPQGLAYAKIAPIPRARRLLVGLSDVPTGVFPVIGDVLKRLPDWSGPTCGVGIGTILILLGLEKVGKRWGEEHHVVKYMASSRAVVVLVIFTLVSYLGNKDRGRDLRWAISKVETPGIAPPRAHDGALISKVAVRAIAPLIAGALEHLAVGKAFSRRNGSLIDESQELTYLGLTNLVNSFFGAMPVGGAMSRTAVNSECHVRSPLSGIVTSAFILLTLYVVSPALYWLPKTTLSAIIIMAVLHLVGPVSAFYRYWRISLADFVAAMASFWLTIFVSAEIGIGCAAAWSVAWTMIRSAFITPAIFASTQDEAFGLPRRASAADQPGADERSSRTEPASMTIPDDTVVVRFNDSIFYPNAHRGKRSVLDAIQLRVVLKDVPLSVVVWDFTAVPFVDVTAILALGELREDIRLHGGKRVQLRIVGMTRAVRERFLRARWKLTDPEAWHGEGADVVYPSVERAVLDRTSISDDVILEKVAVDDAKKIADEAPKILTAFDGSACGLDAQKVSHVLSYARARVASKVSAGYSILLALRIPAYISRSSVAEPRPSSWITTSTRRSWEVKTMLFTAQISAFDQSTSRVPGAAIPTLGLKGLLSNTVANASVAVEDSAKVKEKVLKIANTVAKKIEKQMKWQRSDKHGGKRWTYAAMVPSEVVFMKVFSLKEEIIYCVHYSRRGIPYRELVQPFEAIATNGERDIGQIQDASHEISRRNAHVNVEAELGPNFETDLNEALEAEPLGENPILEEAIRRKDENKIANGRRIAELEREVHKKLLKTETKMCEALHVKNSAIANL